MMINPDDWLDLDVCAHLKTTLDSHECNTGSDIKVVYESLAKCCSLQSLWADSSFVIAKQNEIAF